MSVQKSIGWAMTTINPLGHGCYGPGGTAENPKVCDYCYAKRFANRKMMKCQKCRDFIPHWHPEQLEKLKARKPKTFFVQSMGDMFGDWVSLLNVLLVFDYCLANPQHQYLFLTKNPSRMWYCVNTYKTMKTIPKNWWFGTTVTCQDDVDKLCGSIYNTFVSVEPIRGGIDLHKHLNYLDWVIIGRNSNPGAAKPQDSWVLNLAKQVKDHNVPLFIKSNLGGTGMVQEVPSRITDHLKSYIGRNYKYEKRQNPSSCGTEGGD